jgi:hypothetical protein
MPSASQCTHIGPALSASVRMLRARTTVLLGLGAAVVFSLLSVCCVLGLATTPWFICELFCLQLALCTGQPVARGLWFVPAGALLLVAVLLVSAVAWITLLGTGPELSSQVPRLFSLSLLMRTGGFYAVISSAIALILIAPLLFAPLLILEQHWRFDAALIESVRLVVTRGVLGHVRLALCAHALQVAPLLAAAWFTLQFDPSQLPIGVLCAAPFLCASVPLGQGMLVWSYTQTREPALAEPSQSTTPSEALEPSRASQPDADVRLGLRSTGLHARAWSLLIVVPIASLVLLELALVRPSRVPAGHAPAGQLLAVLTPSGSQPARTQLSDTALEVSVSASEARVAASDGGGAGRLPLMAAGPIARARVVRVRDAFAIELRQDGRDYVTWVDRAGVRLDDDLRVRLLDRVSPTQLWLLLCTLLLTAVSSVPVLNDLGRVQRGYRLPQARRPSADVLALDRTRSERRARIWALALAPLSLACLVLALRSAFAS